MGLWVAESSRGALQAARTVWRGAAWRREPGTGGQSQKGTVSSPDGQAFQVLVKIGFYSKRDEPFPGPEQGRGLV